MNKLLPYSIRSNIKYFSEKRPVLDLTRRSLNFENKGLFNLKNVQANSKPLKEHLYSKLKLEGPIGLDEYMKICLYDKNFGYYTTKDHIFGEKGDFITAPEVSQMFGETIAIFLYKILEDTFKFPTSWELLEIGAGRGFLMADILNSFSQFRCIEGLKVTIIEKSEKLSKIQQQNINNILLKKGIFTEYIYDKNRKIDTFVDVKKRFTMNWYSSLDKYIAHRNNLIIQDYKNPLEIFKRYTNAVEMPNLDPLIIINNELFDALPTKKFVFSENHWRELLIDVDEKKEENESNLIVFTNKESNDDKKGNQIKFKYSLSPPNTDNVLKYLNPESTFVEQGIMAQEGDSYEFSVDQIRYMYAISYLLATTRQSQALIIDYGEDHAFSNSFRAIKSHKVIKNQEILDRTGECDLTSYVNFKALKKVVSKYSSLKVGGLMKQGDFLEVLQIYNRMQYLQSTQHSAKNKEILMKQYQKLTGENEMGDVYKFFYIHKNFHKPTYPFIPEVFDEINKIQKT